jgi:recombination protein RecA
MSKKTTTTEDEVDTTHSKLIKDIEEQYGNICKDGTTLLNTKSTLFKISPSIDLGLNGGILSGTWSLISGLPKTGKTTLALSIIAASQKNEYNKDTKRHSYYIDVEGRLKSINLSGIVGIDTNRMTVIKSEKGNILSAEKFLSIAEKICHTCPGSILIIDSLSALCAEKELIGDMDSQTRASGPKLIAQFCRKLANVVPINDITVIAIQHLMANTSGYGQPLLEDGGNKIQYQSDLKMRVKSIEPYKVGSGQNETRIGQIINWTVLFSPLGCVPGTTISSYLRYGMGFDNIREYIAQAIGFGIIDKKGAWYYFGEEKFQGTDNLWTSMNEDPKLLARIKEQIHKITGT